MEGIKRLPDHVIATNFRAQSDKSTFETMNNIIGNLNYYGMLKSFLYKSEEYLIDYSFNDGSIITYRYIPSTARDVIWIHPFNSLYDLDNENVDPDRAREVNVGPDADRARNLYLSQRFFKQYRDFWPSTAYSPPQRRNSNHDFTINQSTTTHEIS